MAITPLTGFKAFTFDGETSTDYGVQILGEGVFNAPEREVEMINIPGRNGAFALDKGRFENIDVKYPANIIADSTADFAEAVSDLRNFLCSRKGYCRLTDDYHPDEYRMAVYREGLEVDERVLRAGDFDIVFDCMPQRFLTSGEDPITIGEWGETETASGTIASFEAVEGDSIKSLVADIEPIQDLHGYDKPWAGGAGKNKLPMTVSGIKAANTYGTWSGNAYTFNDITFTLQTSDGTNVDSITVNGTATATAGLEIKPAISLSGDYIVNGCPAGGANNTYRLDARPTSGGVLVEEYGNGSSFTYTGDVYGYIRIQSGVTVENKVFKPMIRLSSVSDATWQPYSNICPISGYGSVVVSRCGKNLLTNVKHLVGNSIIFGTNTASGTTMYLDAGTYTFSFTATDGNATNFYVQDTDTDTRLVGGGITSHYTFTISAGCNVRIWCWKSNYNAVDIITTAQLEIGSSATSYEPYNGTTYTTDLNGTRYGGTLDVVSGVLTVTHKYVDLSTLTWTTAANSRWACVVSDIKPPASLAVATDAISSHFSAYSADVLYAQTSLIGMAVHTNKTVLVRNGSTTDTPVGDFVYELATPTTVQLTAQEVELLVGLNQIWANSGDVTVEYGTDPNVVVNPTLFEARPMLEVEGYGEIDVNGEAITLRNVPYGEIAIGGPMTKTVTDSEILTTIIFKIDTDLLNANDYIYTNNLYATINYKTNAAYTVGTCTVGTTVLAKGTTNANGTARKVEAIVPDFHYGTADESSSYVNFNESWTQGGTSYTQTQAIQLKTEYDGADTLTFKLNFTVSSCYNSATTKAVNIPQITAKSTVSALGHPTYIDLDIGEAYNIVSDKVISLNNVVQLPTELPTLKSGVNEITFDNTVTELKVVPRWWKV